MVLLLRQLSLTGEIEHRPDCAAPDVVDRKFQQLGCSLVGQNHPGGGIRHEYGITERKEDALKEILRFLYSNLCFQFLLKLIGLEEKAKLAEQDLGLQGFRHEVDGAR